MAKVESSDYDAVVLAMAGLERLGLAEKAAHIFSIDEMTPAVGQGALGVEMRADDAEAMELLGAIDHAATRAGGDGRAGVPGAAGRRMPDAGGRARDPFGGDMHAAGDPRHAGGAAGFGAARAGEERGGAGAADGGRVAAAAVAGAGRP